MVLFFIVLFLWCFVVVQAFLVTGQSLERILEANSSSSTPLLISDEEVRSIDVQLVQRGDVVKVFPGGRIPTDGTIVFGKTHIDESMMTGESLPVFKGNGDTVFGSTVNQDNCIYVSVSSYGTESALAQIVRLVEKAQMNKAPIQDYADKIAGYFTPAILCIAVVTFIVWYSLAESGIVPHSWFAEEFNDPFLFSLLFAISVVVISCPCALGLATPTAIMVGTAVGAQNGVLIKGGSAFEVAHK
jgi:P-type Cu+ transporter